MELTSAKGLASPSCQFVTSPLVATVVSGVSGEKYDTSFSHHPPLDTVEFVRSVGMGGRSVLVGVDLLAIVLDRPSIGDRR
jgi:hypothetical protein